MQEIIILHNTHVCRNTFQAAAYVIGKQQHDVFAPALSSSLLKMQNTNSTPRPAARLSDSCKRTTGIKTAQRDVKLHKKDSKGSQRDAGLLERKLKGSER